MLIKRAKKEKATGIQNEKSSLHRHDTSNEWKTSRKKLQTSFFFRCEKAKAKTEAANRQMPTGERQ